LPRAFSFAALLNFFFGTFRSETSQKEALYKLDMIRKHRLTSNTLIFVSSRHLILRYTHGLINGDITGGGSESFQPIVYLFRERDLVVSSKAFVRLVPSSTSARRLHSRSTLFFLEAEAYRIGGMGGIFGVKSFFSGFLA